MQKCYAFIFMIKLNYMCFLADKMKQFTCTGNKWTLRTEIKTNSADYEFTSDP